MEKRQKRTRLQNASCVMLILVLLGFVISAQIKSVAMEQKKTEADRQEQIAQYEEKIAQLEAELAENKAQYAVLSDKYDAEMKSLYENDKQFYELYKKYETDVEQYKFYAGLTTVSGSGIDIGLDDAQKKYESMSTFIVHDIYINEIINILRIAGAQAISVNGERIVAMSETLCLGPSIRVNNTKLFAPYHIEAIGDPQALLAAVKSSAIYETMLKENLIVDPVIKEQIVIKKYNKSYEGSIDLLTESE